jgi:hypothetical protein
MSTRYGFPGDPPKLEKISLNLVDYQKVPALTLQILRWLNNALERHGRLRDVRLHHFHPVENELDEDGCSWK